MKGSFSMLLIFISRFSFAQPPSPEQFLGYKIGTHFTPHYRIAAYVKAVAAASPTTVKWQQYGTTNEGRPLMVLFISSAQNISNLESIRQNNIAVANGRGIAGQTAIVWLSYNVHGNEPASSEAAMLTIYALADPQNQQTKAWLQNIVVIIDPCLNPDGRDRYVNWYNSVVGASFNPSPLAREHQEPWPKGRTNHYNFDLNRDWAWQTQIESGARVALYNLWLPQVHVDFHEQGYNEPYYFAPAAEPYHEVITKWQRDFQTTIGHNHAKYFDAAGWLYFTKERFDLLYPSYGDTYPLYNGSIGMTYEQGGIDAGLGILTSSGDTLTLADRAQHHFTTGLSTVEVASKNATQLLNEFTAYYKAANNGIGEYKAYVVKMGINKQTALLELLNKNNIRCYQGKPATLRGLNYDNGKEEAFTINENDLVVPTAQPKSNLIKVLFDPSSKLSDSATYDITAWSLPYVYGVKAYAVKTPVAMGTSYTIDNPVNTIAEASTYAYVIPWTGINAAKLTGQLLQQKIKLRFATVPFESGGQKFDRGAVLILKTGNSSIASLWQTVSKAAVDNHVKLASISGGMVDKGLDFGSSSVVPLKSRRVALLTGDGVSFTAAGEVWHLFEQVLQYPVSLIQVTDAGRMNWNDYDVVIMPDGSYRFLSEKPAADAMKTWITNGGHLIALEGGVMALSRLDWAIKARKGDDGEAKYSYENIRPYEARERDALSAGTPGSIYKVSIDNTHPLGFGYPDFYYTLKQDSSLYDFIKEDGWNVGILKKDKPVAGFVGSKLSKRLQNGLLFGVQDLGRGTITYFADDVLFRSFWENGKLMFANALFLVGQ